MKFAKCSGLILILMPLIDLLSSNITHSAIPKHWATTSYSYQTESNSLRNVLQDFAAAFGLRTEFSNEFNQIIKGKFRSKSAQDFLERLALEHRFNWFVFSGKLYVAEAKNYQVKRIEVGELSAGNLKKALTAIGLLDNRFGWGELPGENIVLVSGPKRYVELITSLSKGEETQKKQDKILSFKLQHASVADRVINYRNRSITIPGAATVLRDILRGGSSRTATPSQLNPKNDKQQIKTKTAGKQAIEGFHAMLGGSQQQRSNVVADIRNNSILVKDKPEKHHEIQSIINKIDVPLQLMDINAIIIDVSSEKLRHLGFNWLFNDSVTTVNTSGALWVKQVGDFIARLHALESQGEVKITASPSVITQENHPAVIDLSQNVHQVATGERVAEFNTVTAGTSLRVTPRVIKRGGQRAIQLIVDIEDGSLQSAIQDNLIVQTSHISTQAVIEHGHALVLGGFTTSKRYRQTNQIPYIAEVPIAGKLFTHSEQHVSQRQRLFILIPRFIEQDIASFLPKKRKKLIQPIVSNQVIIDSFKALVEGYIPSGFKITADTKHLLCEKLNDRINFNHGQWLEGQQFNIAVGTVTGSNSDETIDPSLCDEPNVLAVTFWPPQPLKPGQLSEIMIAFQP